MRLGLCRLNRPGPVPILGTRPNPDFPNRAVLVPVLGMRLDLHCRNRPGSVPVLGMRLEVFCQNQPRVLYGFWRPKSNPGMAQCRKVHCFQSSDVSILHTDSGKFKKWDKQVPTQEKIEKFWRSIPNEERTLS